MAKLAVIGGIIGIIVLGAVVYFGMSISYKTKEVELRNAIVAKQKANEASFDTCWKIVQQQAQVTDSYKESFKEIYKGLMEGRHYEAGGQFMKWIKESNPKFDVKLYVKLANSIEAQRTRFMKDQEDLLAIKQQHDNLLDSPVSGFFLSGKQKVDVKIVTSGKTQEAFNTGKEDDINVFQKK